MNPIQMLGKGKKLKNDADKLGNSLGALKVRDSADDEVTRKSESSFITSFLSKGGDKKLNYDYFGYVTLDGMACWVLADGLDKEAGAGIASETAANEILELFLENPEFSGEFLETGIKLAQKRIQNLQERSIEKAQMSTSIAILITDYHSVMWAHVGNTRVYHIRNGYINHKTRDDSVAEIMLRRKGINKGIRHHERRNDLTKVLGDRGKIKANIQKVPYPLKEGDALLLATYGAWEHLDDEVVEINYSKSESPKKWVQGMEEEILKSEKLENYSLVGVGIDKVAPEIDYSKSKKWMKVMIGVFLLVGLAGGGVYYYFNTYEYREMVKNIKDYQVAAEEYNREQEFNLASLEYEKAFAVLDSLGKNGRNYEKLLTELTEKQELTKNLEKAMEMKINADEKMGSRSYSQAEMTYEDSKTTFLNKGRLDVVDEINKSLETLGGERREHMVEAAQYENLGYELETVDYRKALVNFEKAKDVYEKIGEKEKLSIMEIKVNSITRRISELDEKAYDLELEGNYAYNMGEYEKARGLYIEAKEVRNTLSNKREGTLEAKIELAWGASIEKQADTLKENKLYERALAEYKQSEGKYISAGSVKDRGRISGKIDDTVDIITHIAAVENGDKGDIYYEEKKYKEAAREYEQALVKYESLTEYKPIEKEYDSIIAALNKKVERSYKRDKRPYIIF